MSISSKNYRTVAKGKFSKIIKSFIEPNNKFKNRSKAVVKRWKKINKRKEKRVNDNLIIALIILVHTIVSFCLLFNLEANDFLSKAIRVFFDTLGLSSHTFFSNFIIQGIIAYLVLFAVSKYSGRPKNLKDIIGLIFCISFIVSILLSSDKQQAIGSDYPSSFGAAAYRLITEKSALLLVFIVTFIAIIYGIYYLIRSLSVVTYTGPGPQIQSLGHTTFYLPVYPQIGWQSTGIPVKEGENLEIEISGYVSPGMGDENPNKLSRMKEFVEWIKKGSNPDTWSEEFLPGNWPYTGPKGYPKEWYGKEKPTVLKTHLLYGSKDYYFQEDKFLTVKGLPHNTVVGFIEGSSDGKPLEATYREAAYDWREDREKLYNLSSANYPVTIKIRKTGTFWVVINDVDMARWDNGGLFFMKLTKKRWF